MVLSVEEENIDESALCPPESALSVSFRQTSHQSSQVIILLFMLTVFER